MKLHPSELAFLRELASTRDSWVMTAADALVSSSGPLAWSELPGDWSRLSRILNDPADQRAFHSVVRELLSSQVHSLLVTLDGGSALADTTEITIQDNKGYTFKKFLHEFWPEVGEE